MKSVRVDTAIEDSFAGRLSAENIDIVWPGDRYAASDGKTIEYSTVSSERRSQH